MDDRYRGKAVLRAMVRFMARDLESQYQTAVAFVEGSNLASTRAHDRLGFTELAQFKIVDRAFSVLSLPVRDVD